jgi:hypothetical protein
MEKPLATEDQKKMCFRVLIAAQYLFLPTPNDPQKVS